MWCDKEKQTNGVIANVGKDNWRYSLPSKASASKFSVLQEDIMKDLKESF